jgi:hypothetical protein
MTCQDSECHGRPFQSVCQSYAGYASEMLVMPSHRARRRVWTGVRVRTSRTRRWPRFPRSTPLGEPPLGEPRLGVPRDKPDRRGRRDRLDGPDGGGTVSRGGIAPVDGAASECEGADGGDGGCERG